MKKQIHVRHNPLTNTIFAGSLMRNNTLGAANRTDVTAEALLSVAKHVKQWKEESGKDLVLSTPGKDDIVITVTRRKPEGNHDH